MPERDGPDDPSGGRGPAATGSLRRVLVAQLVHPSGLDHLRGAGIEVRDEPVADTRALEAVIGWADALIVRNLRVDGACLAAAPRLKAIGVQGVGVDGIDLAAATAAGILVFNTPDSNALSVAEHTLALMLAVAKRIEPAHAALREGDYAYRYAAAPIDLGGRTLGLVGLGRVGSQVGRLALAFGMEVIAFDPARAAGDARSDGIELVGNLGDLLGRADVVSIHVPLVPATRNLLDRARLDQLRPGAIVINTARGGVVDEDALLEALDSGHVSGAGLDVFATEPVPPGHPLVLHPRVVATPHLAGSSDRAMIRASMALAEGLLRLARGEQPAAVVNPDAWPATVERLAGSNASDAPA